MNAASEADAWYVCFTKPRQEPLACERLHSQGYETYLPELSRWIRHSRGWKRSRCALFPRYLFVKPAAPSQSIAPVRSTTGVSTLVSFGHQLARLPQAHMDALRGVLAQAEQALPNNPFTAGMSVAFADGPLKGLQGIVSSVAEERVTVLFNLVGQPQRVAVAPNQLLAA